MESDNKLEKFNNKIINKIILEGLKKYSSKFVFQNLSISEKTQFDLKKVKASFQDLLNLNIFENIILNAKEENGELHLIFSFIEFPLIDSLKIYGINKVEKSDILNIIRLKKGYPYNPAILDKNLKQIEKLYLDKGFEKVHIKINMEGRKEDKVNISIHINENSPIFIQNVRIIGTKYLNPDEIQSFIKTKAGSIFSTDQILNQDNLNDDKKSIEKFLKMKGHYLGQVKFIKIIQENQAFSILIEIEEGPRFKFGNIILNNLNLVLKNEDFLEIFKIKEGDIFNNELVEFYKHQIRQFYQDRAYLQVQINHEYIVNEQALSIDVEISIIEGEKVHIRRIEIINNEKTRFSVIDQELEIFEGELFNSKKLKNSIQNLMNIKYFSMVNPIIQPTEYSQIVDLKLDVKESLSGLFTLGLNYSPETSIGGNIVYNQPNFLGSGWALSGKIGGSIKSANVNIGTDTNWLVPYIPVQFGIDVGYSWQKIKVNPLIKKYLYSKEVNYEYEYQDASIDLKVGYPVLRELIIYTGFTFAFYNFDDPTFSLSYLDNSTKSSKLKKDLSANKDFFSRISMFFGFMYDIRDSKVNTKNGLLIHTKLTFTGGIPFFGDSHWIKLGQYISGYYNPFWQVVLSLHVRYETFFKQFTGQFELRDNELISFSYASEIRGWKSLSEESITSSGSKISISKEIKIPLFENLLASILFFDLGDIGDNAPSFPTQIRYYSFGFGLEIQVPSIPMPLVLFFAKKFDYDLTIPKKVFLHDSFELVFSFSHFF